MSTGGGAASNGIGKEAFGGNHSNNRRWLAKSLMRLDVMILDSP
jgi:hypothetical protein